MKKQILISLFSLGFIFKVNAQQIGDGMAPVITDFSSVLKSGVYSGFNASGSFPDNSYGGWQHLLVIRHTSPNNNHQFQFGTSFLENDRLFFRKIANIYLAPSNPSWIELATRGNNTFSGNQIILGSVSSTEISVKQNLNLGTNEGTSTISGPGNSGAIQIKTNLYNGGSSNRFLRLGWKNNNSVFFPVLSINDDFNVGIGTTSPAYKLDVCGTIRAKEIKVDLLGGCDFVFKNDYKLMDLKTLEQFVKTNQHLPEIAPEKVMIENGINMKELQMKLLQKMEEMTLYIIEQNKKNELQSKEIELLKLEIEILKTK